MSGRSRAPKRRKPQIRMNDGEQLRPQIHDQLVAASGLPGELLFTRERQREKARKKNSAKGKGSARRAPTQTELETAYRTLPAEDLLDRLNAAANERLMATAQYHGQHQLGRSALLAAGILVQEFVRDCVEKQLLGEPVVMPINHSCRRLMTEPVDIDSDEEFKRKDKGKGKAPMPPLAPNLHLRPPKLVIDADDIPISTLEVLRKTYGKSPRNVAPVNPSPDSAPMGTASGAVTRDAMGRGTPKRQSAITAAHRIATLGTPSQDGSNGNASAPHHDEEEDGEEEEAGTEESTMGAGVGAIAGTKPTPLRSGERSREGVKKSGLGLEPGDETEVSGLARGLAGDGIPSGADRLQRGIKDGQGGSAVTVVRLAPPPDPYKVRLERSLLAWATRRKPLVPRRRWKFVYFPLSARRKSTKRRVPQRRPVAPIEITVPAPQPLSLDERKKVRQQARASAKAAKAAKPKLKVGRPARQQESEASLPAPPLKKLLPRLPVHAAMLRYPGPRPWVAAPQLMPFPAPYYTAWSHQAQPFFRPLMPFPRPNPVFSQQRAQSSMAVPPDSALTVASAASLELPCEPHEGYSTEENSGDEA